MVDTRFVGVCSLGITSLCYEVLERNNEVGKYIFLYDHCRIAIVASGMVDD